MHSLPYNQMEVKGELCAQATLTFRLSDPIAYGARWWMGPRSNRWRERSLTPIGSLITFSKLSIP